VATKATSLSCRASGAIDMSIRPKTAIADPTTDERAAAIGDYEQRISRAWEGDQVFSNALYMAYVAGELKLLRDYVNAGKPVPQDIPVSVADQVVPMHVLVAQLLGEGPPNEQRLGRPPRVASQASAAEQAERNAAWLVAFMLKGWRVHNHRKRVPEIEVKKMISAAITQASKAFGVSVNAINESNIRGLLKSGRVVVRSRTPT
jgi:hypothetical protein